MRTLNTTTLDNMESFIIDYQKRKGKSPSFREVMKALNMSSLNLVRTYILALENSGRIERTRLGNIDMLPKYVFCGQCGRLLHRRTMWITREKGYCQNGCKCEKYIDDVEKVRNPVLCKS